MGLVAALLPPPQLQRLHAALGEQHEVLVCADWATLLAKCERQAVRVAVIDLFAEGKTNFDELRHLKQRLPRLALICYVNVSTERARDLFDAGRQGMDGLVVFDQDDSPREFLRLIGHAESRALSDIVRRALSGVDSMVYDAVLLSITRAHERLSPTTLARLLQVPRRTVSQRLARAGYPAPLRLLTWGRLMVAANMLEDQARSAERVAQSLEFPSGGAFRNSCQRYLRAKPGEIRGRGGASYVMRTFFSEVRGDSGTQALERLADPSPEEMSRQHAS